MFEIDDDYQHPTSDVFYIEENILGSGWTEDSDVSDAFYSQLSHQCDCEGSCIPSKMCLCISRFGKQNYREDEISGNLTLPEYKAHIPIFECNKLCKCTKYCGNRLVQHGPRKHLDIKTTSKGLGLFTDKFVPRGSFICEYAGEIISKCEAVKRHYTITKENKMNYIFCLSEHCDGNRTQTFVDPSAFGNIGRYINHSCEPNCHIVAVRINCPLPKLAIFSLKDIEKGTEITYDYGLGERDKAESSGARRTKCLCGSKQCRQWLPFETYS